MKLHALRTVASRTATAVGAAVIATVVVAGSLSVAQAATEAIAPNSITSAMIRDGAVKSADVKDGAITGADLTDNSVAGVDIQNSAVDTTHIDDGSVLSGDIRDGTVAGADIAPNTVSSLHIMNGQVSSLDIANGSITSADVDASVGQPRVSVFVDGAATPGQFTTSRATGVQSVTNPSNGLFCITPVDGVDVGSVVPIVSITFSGTATADAIAGWSLDQFECPSAAIAVFATTSQFSQNDVGFTVVVP